MYHTIKTAKEGINAINKVYSSLEEIFEGHSSMTRGEILKTYSKIEKIIIKDEFGDQYKKRVLPTFETLRKLGLLEVAKKEQRTMYFYTTFFKNICLSKKQFEQLPIEEQEKYKPECVTYYYYSLVPKDIAIANILNAVNNNFSELLKLAE